MQKLGDYYNYDSLKLLNDSLEHVRAFFLLTHKACLAILYIYIYIIQHTIAEIPSEINFEF